ncbi:hypothetical protein [Pedobacter mendelii]|uniref:hypothetical protein n=1 Tax=Pedobacter mendelii TaxID=1908240 RepID=UPI0016669E43|nr:hypothetical protein [Pedobacter mendelii]
MTFIKYLLWKLKNTSSNYWLLLGLRIFVRLLGVTTMFYFLDVLRFPIDSGTKYLYTFISTLFYLLFFIFLDWYLKVFSNEELKDKGVKWLNILKWMPLLFCFSLVYLTVQSNSFSWPENASSKIIYSYSKVWPAIFVPNLSFIIITTLVFYSSAILNRNMELKQENDLTI